MTGNVPSPEAGSREAPIRRILWISFLVAVVVYGVMGYLVFARSVSSPPLLPDWIWALIAVAMAGAALWLPGNLPARNAATSGGLRTSEIVGWSLAESVAVVGLISVALGGARVYLLAYLAVAAAILWFQRPSD